MNGFQSGALPYSLPPLEGYTFRGFRNKDGSSCTRNILAISTSVQCVAGVVDHALRKIRTELLPKYPNVDNVIALEHVYGCGVAINAPDAVIPIRTLRNIARNPNFGGQAMVVSLGCEKLQPDVLFPTQSIPIRDIRQQPDLQGVGVVCLQEDEHGGFEAMIDSIVDMAESRLRSEETTSELTSLK